MSRVGLCGADRGAPATDAPTTRDLADSAFFHPASSLRPPGCVFTYVPVGLGAAEGRGRDAQTTEKDGRGAGRPDIR